MLAYGFVRLLSRPSMAIWFGLAWALALGFSAVLADAARAGRTLLADDSSSPGALVFLLCTFTMVPVSLANQELQASTAVITLPGLPARLRAGLLTVATIVLLLASAVYWSMTMSVPGVAVVAIAALGIGLGLVIADPLGARAVTLGASVLVAVIAIGWSSAAAMAAGHPVVAVLVVVLALVWSARRALGDETFRLKPFVPTLNLVSFFSLPIEQSYCRARLQARPAADCDWPYPSIGTSTWRWIRAAMYEVSGYRRFGWVGHQLSGTLAATLVLAFFNAFEAWEDGTGWRTGLAYAYRSALYTASTDPMPPHEGLDYWVVAWMIATIWIAMSFNAPLKLQSSLLYPLSRRERGRLAHLAALLQVAVLALGSLVSLGVLFGSIGLAFGLPLLVGALPNFVRAVLVVAALYPVAQWWPILRRGNYWTGWIPPLFLAGTFVFCGVTSVAVSFWGSAFHSLGPGVELAALLALIGLSQTIFRRILIRHFERSDLS